MMTRFLVSQKLASDRQKLAAARQNLAELNQKKAESFISLQLCSLTEGEHEWNAHREEWIALPPPHTSAQALRRSTGWSAMVAYRNRVGCHSSGLFGIARSWTAHLTNYLTNSPGVIGNAAQTETT
jgi:hypothetical protein